MVNQEYNNIYEHLPNYEEVNPLTDENIKETKEIQENNMIFNINREWERAEESPESSETEDDWYAPPDLMFNVIDERTSRVDQVDSILYEGYQFTNSLLISDPLTHKLDKIVKSKPQLVHQVKDGLDNLTYREDSLSVIKGTVSTRLGRNLPVWILTDSGAMTQLIQREYAEKMRMVMDPIPRTQQFNISSPRGGYSQVTHQVVIDVTLSVHRINTTEEEYIYIPQGTRTRKKSRLKCHLESSKNCQSRSCGVVNKCAQRNVMISTRSVRSP